MSYSEWCQGEKSYADRVARSLADKLPASVAAARQCGFIPYTAKDGAWLPGPFDGVSWWTNGFWPGLMWAMYRLTGDPLYSEEANRTEALLDEAFREFDHLHHDVGFMWLISSGANERMNGGEMSRRRTLLAANLLAGRFNPAGFIRAWNGDNVGWAIIDCMMNLNLLYRASDMTGDPRFRRIAMAHADTTMARFVREDGSCNHIVIFDPETGEVLEAPAGQGYAPGSSWSRGQSWALYGFTLSYIHTGKRAYLDTACRVAGRFLEALKHDPVPRCDFCQPQEDNLKDACAGAVAACGLLELARLTNEKKWFSGAMDIHRALTDRCADFTCNTPSVVMHCTEAYHNGKRDIPMVYADFFYVEALLKLLGDDFLFW